MRNNLKYKDNTKYRMKRSDGRVYEVRYCTNGKYEIMEDCGWTGHYSALMELWIPVEEFDSLVKAVRFLKENIESFM